MNCGQSFVGHGYYCPKCQEEEDRKYEAEFQLHVPEYIDEAGIPDGYRYWRGTNLSTVQGGPIVKHAAEWVMRHITVSLVLKNSIGCLS